MQRTTSLISDINITEERLRKDNGDLELLKHSISVYGLLQPIVINQNRELIAGGRRLAAHKELGLKTIDVVYYETLSEGQRLELEALENIIRKQMTWQEECLSMLRIYKQRSREAALNPETEKWNQRLASELFGISIGALNYILVVARKLEAELSLPPEAPRPYHACSSAQEAYRVVFLGEQEKAALAELAKRQAAATQTKAQEDAFKVLVSEVKAVQSSPDLLAAERARYESNPHNNKQSFEEYWKNKVQVAQQAESTVFLSNRLHNGDCIPYMLDCPDCFHAIFTDIPYGIDMEMLNQNNQHGGLTDLDRVKEEHDVEENMKLMERFFPAAFRCTKEKAFLVTYCDISQWQYMSDLATAAGWCVQRWPFIWIKTTAMNQCASYNTTKNYEIMMLCRKPGTVLIKSINSSTELAGSEAARMEYGHPFSKPAAITQLLLPAIAVPGSSILEPFAGRGSIAIEATKLRYNVIACEKQEDHFNALMENYKRYYLSLNSNTVFK